MSTLRRAFDDFKRSRATLTMLLLSVLPAAASAQVMGPERGALVAIVVRGDQFEVIGTSYVVIHDNQSQVPADPPETWRAVGGSFYFLRPGDTCDLAKREAFRPGTTQRPIDRIVPRRGSGR